jgi:hypothetical protein
MHYALTERQMRLLSVAIDRSFISPLEKSGKVFDYVSAPYVLEILDKVFDGVWSYRIIDHWTEETYQWDKNTRQLTDKRFRNVAHVIAEIKFPVYPQKDYDDEDLSGIPPVWITKTGVGTSPMIGSDDVQKQQFKSAMTDALKKAATLIGIGRELYLDDNEDNSKLDEFDTWLANVENKRIWTPYDKLRYQDAFNTIGNLCRILGVTSEDDYNLCIQRFLQDSKSNEQELLPNNIEQFIVWMKELTRQHVEKDKQENGGVD